MTPPTIDDFAAVLTAQFTDLIRLKEGNLWTGPEVMAVFNDAVQRAQKWASGIAP